MNYRVVYDVLDDPLIAGQEGGLIMLGFALSWTALWVVLHRWNPGMPEERRKNWRIGPVIGGIFVAVAILILANDTYPTAVDRLRCRDWARRGDYLTAEGPVAHFRREPGKNPVRHFELNGIAFSYRMSHPKAAGFWGEFTAPGAESLQIQDGLMLRLAHRDGRILRIEVGE